MSKQVVAIAVGVGAAATAVGVLALRSWLGNGSGGESSSNENVDYFAAPRGTVSAESAAVIKATLEPVVANLDKIVSTFYATMFKNNPETLAFFNMTNQRSGNQGKSLAASLLAAVPCTLEPGKLEALAQHLGVVFHKHVALGVKPEHYAIVHDNFMSAVGQVLGSAVTPEVAAAWSEAVMVVADVFVRHEVALEASVAAATGGWRGPEPMRVVSVAAAADDGSAKTVTLEMMTDGIACVWTPGQYLTLHAPASMGVNAPRHYTITDGTLTTLSITVRKEVGGGEHPDGLLSSYVHSLKVGDVVHARPPMGVFTPTPHPLVEVFIGGGVGVTPMLPLATAAIDNGAKVALFTSARTPAHAVLADDIAALATNPAVVLHSATHTGAGDKRLSADAICSALAGASLDPTGRNTVYNICGPRGFMEDIIAGLHANSVSPDNIKFEAFGPTGNLSA